MRTSKLQIYSIGVVAANKALDSNIIEVILTEDSPMLDGDLNSDQTDETVASQDSHGGEYNVNLKSSLSVQAEWLPMGYGNRKTSPDVRRGAQVVLYHFADPHKLYWMTLKEDLHLRKLETVVWAFSATKDENDKVGSDTHYYLEISTHKKLVHFHTTKKNAEPYGYDIQINTDKGFVKIQDDAGNEFMLDSVEKQLVLKNGDDCYLEINKKNMNLNVPETLTVTAKNVVENIIETVKTKAGNSISEDTKEYLLKASTSVKEETGTYSVNSSGKANIKAGGQVVIDGNGVRITKGVQLG